MDDRKIRLNKVSRMLNISIQQACDYLRSKSIQIDVNPNVLISDEEYLILYNEFKNKIISNYGNINNKKSIIDINTKHTIKNNHNNFEVNIQNDRNTLVKEFNNKENIENEYFRSKIIVFNLNRAKDHFVTQYGNDELHQIKGATLNSNSVKKLYLLLENKYWPTAEQIINAVSYVEYINSSTNYYFKSEKAIEKKIDYINIAAILILENWLFNLLPHQEKNPALSIPNMGVIEMGWMMSENIWKKLFEICTKIKS